MTALDSDENHESQNVGELLHRLNKQLKNLLGSVGTCIVTHLKRGMLLELGKSNFLQIGYVDSVATSIL